MKILKCKLCSGEVDIVGNDRSIIKKTKGHTNDTTHKEPEVIIMRRRS